MYCLSMFSVVFTFFSLLKLLFVLKYKIPIKELAIVFLCIQLLLSPLLDYNYFPYWSFKLAVSERTYINYAFPAILFFYIGLYWPFKKSKRFRKHTYLLKQIEGNRLRVIKTGFWLVFIGFTADLIPDELGLGFTIKIFSYFKITGALYVWFAKSKFAIPLVSIVFLSVLLNAISSGFFINIIIWGIFMYAFLSIKFRISVWKSFVFGLVGGIFILILQTAKGEYRKKIWEANKYENHNQIVLLYEAISNQIEKINKEELLNLVEFLNYRLNQGWIVTQIMKEYDENNNATRGIYFYREMIGIILPRIIYPDKPVVADRVKFEKMTGIALSNGTVMNVGLLGDGYGNFGYRGGIVFCFLFALFLNLSLYTIHKISLYKQPTLILWTPAIFFFAIRAGNDFYIMTNWMVKYTMVVIFFYWITSRRIRIYIKGDKKQTSFLYPRG